MSKNSKHAKGDKMANDTGEIFVRCKICRCEAKKEARERERRNAPKQRPSGTDAHTPQVVTVRGTGGEGHGAVMCVMAVALISAMTVLAALL